MYKNLIFFTAFVCFLLVLKVRAAHWLHDADQQAKSVFTNNLIQNKMT